MGDLVILNEDGGFVAEQSKKLCKEQGLLANYNEETVRTMLGKTYTVVPTDSKMFDENWVRLPNDDGKELYLPKTTVRKVEPGKWT